jgi:DNA repair protein RadC
MIGHNHPDGDLEPSEADIRSTREISGALMPLGIRVLDHIIVSGDKFFSFLDHDIPIV